MGRLLLTLSAACLVTTFVILWKIPFDPAKIYSSFKNEANNTRPAKDSNPEKKPDTPHAIGVKKKARANSSKALSVTDMRSNVRDVEPTPESEVGQDASQKNVKSDSAAVYTVNSSDSAILKLLKRGDRIETDIEVIDTEGRWSLVKGVEEKRSGYVRSENLESKQPAKRKN